MTPQAPTVRVYGLEEICEVLQISRSALQRLRRAGTFPIPELPTLDKHPRWSVDAVEAFLLRQKQTERRPRRLAAVAGRNQLDHAADTQPFAAGRKGETRFR